VLLWPTRPSLKFKNGVITSASRSIPTEWSGKHVPDIPQSAAWFSARDRESRELLSDLDIRIFQVIRFRAGKPSIGWQRKFAIIAIRCFEENIE
jgi:hypothetical protein